MSSVVETSLTVLNEGFLDFARNDKQRAKREATRVAKRFSAFIAAWNRLVCPWPPRSEDFPQHLRHLAVNATPP